MILSLCYDYSLNNDCNSHSHCRCDYMQRIYVYFILSCLALSSLESTRQSKARQDEMYIDSLHIMTMTTTMTMTMKIIIR